MRLHKDVQCVSNTSCVQCVSNTYAERRTQQQQQAQEHEKGGWVLTKKTSCVENMVHRHHPSRRSVQHELGLNSNSWVYILIDGMCASSWPTCVNIYVVHERRWPMREHINTC